MSSNGDEADAPKVKSRKPANTAFRQQVRFKGNRRALRPF
jgi:hypothetical protein